MKLKRNNVLSKTLCFESSHKEQPQNFLNRKNCICYLPQSKHALLVPAKRESSWVRIIEKKQKLHTKHKIANSKKKKTQKIANHIERTYTLREETENYSNMLHKIQNYFEQ